MIYVHTKMAMNSLRSNKIRTFLTLLGIIIGVTSVTTIIGLGEGVKQQVNEQINDLGTDLVTIVPGRNASISGFDSLGTGFGATTASTARLSEADLRAVTDHPNVAQASGGMQLDGSVARGSQRLNTRILGVTPNYLAVNNQELRSGQFFGQDIANNQTVVLASDIAADLFGDSDPLGSSVAIRGQNFIVIGVLDTYKGFNFGQPVNDMVVIPLETARRFNQDLIQLQQINIKLKNPALAKQTTAEITGLLRELRGGEEDFTITTQQQLVATTDSVFRVLTGFTAAVASISLLVGGIGVMNIMLVTVTERTREIGIRKAIGATGTQILLQFLIEALMITLTGGLIGIALSLVLGYVISAQTAIRPAMDLWIISLAAGVSLVVGIIFGTWPAIRAARKDPTHALKHE